MNYLRSVLFGIFVFYGFASLGQIRGLVRGVRVSDTLALNGVKVKLLRAKKAVFTDANGKFEIFPGKQVPDTLVALIAGYISDTIVIIDDTVFTPGWEKPYTIGPSQAWSEFLRNKRVVELGRVDYEVGRGMCWGKYVL
ncbi:MAG: hypothetical protein EBV19_04545 [Flavobacteriia bacterium]|nr:hypothetical protein [Flavobacteriia bacterium]